MFELSIGEKLDQQKSREHIVYSSFQPSRRTQQTSKKQSSWKDSKKRWTPSSKVQKSFSPVISTRYEVFMADNPEKKPYSRRLMDQDSYFLREIQRSTKLSSPLTSSSIRYIEQEVRLQDKNNRLRQATDKVIQFESSPSQSKQQQRLMVDSKSIFP